MLNTPNQALKIPLLKAIKEIMPNDKRIIPTIKYTAFRNKGISIEI